MAPVEVDLSTCVARLGWSEFAVRDLNELSRQHALTVGDDTVSPVKVADLLMSGAILASNIVHQMRSTLDNLVRQLVVWNGETPTHANAFPVIEVDNARGRKKFARKLTNVDPTHVAIIDRCQPYHDLQGHPLVLLEKLWNTDKHHILGLIGAEPAVMPVGVLELPSTRWIYNDGTWVIFELRRALAYVMEIVEGFEVLLSTDVDINFPSYPGVMGRMEYLRRRDASATYHDEMLLIQESLKGWHDQPELRLQDVPRDELAMVLNACDRLLDGPVGGLHREWLEPLQAKLLEAINKPRQAESS